MKITPKVIWFLQYLENHFSAQFISPTEIGLRYTYAHGLSLVGSQTASPLLRKMSKMEWIERDEKGHYRLKSRGMSVLSDYRHSLQEEK